MNELKANPEMASERGTTYSVEEARPSVDVSFTASATLLPELPGEPQQSTWRRIAGRFTAGRYLIIGDAVVATCFAVWWEQWTWPLLLGWLLTLLSHASAGLYRPRLHLALLDQVPQLLSQFFIAMTIALTVPALLGVPLELRRHAAGAALMIGAMLAVRGLIFTIIRIGRGSGVVAHPTLIVGNGPRARKVAGVLDRHRSYGLDVIGYIANYPVDSDSGGTWTHLGDFDRIAEVVRERHVEILIFDETSAQHPDLLEGLRHRSSAPSVFVLPPPWELGPVHPADDHVGGVPIQRISRGWSFSQRVGKRLFDLVMAAVSVVVLSPLLLLVALSIFAADRHSPLFKQVRVGRNGQLFTMYKFRSMRPVAEATSDTDWSDASRARIGRIGKFIRATSIDELPQLFNILRGDMTFVGPRPERPHYVQQFSEMFPDYGSRHRVTVGLTGLAQVSGLRGDTSIDDRVRHDNYYIDHWSLWLDLKVLIWTLGQAFGARGS